MCQCNTIAIPINLSHNVVGVSGINIPSVSVQQFVADRLGDFWIQKNAYGQNVLMSTLSEGQDLYLTTTDGMTNRDTRADIVVGGHPIKTRPVA